MSGAISENHVDNGGCLVMQYCIKRFVIHPKMLINYGGYIDVTEYFE